MSTTSGTRAKVSCPFENYQRFFIVVKTVKHKLKSYNSSKIPIASTNWITFSSLHFSPKTPSIVTVSQRHLFLYFASWTHSTIMCLTLSITSSQKLHKVRWPALSFSITLLRVILVCSRRNLLIITSSLQPISSCFPLLWAFPHFVECFSIFCSSFHIVCKFACEWLRTNRCKVSKWIVAASLARVHGLVPQNANMSRQPGQLNVLAQNELFVVGGDCSVDNCLFQEPNLMSQSITYLLKLGLKHDRLLFGLRRAVLTTN